MTFGKAFGLPRLPVLGENARIEFKANAYNIFNKLNLRPFQAFGINQNSTWIGTFNPADGTVTNNPAFGIAEAGLSGRVVELQARFSF
jgi:hypothetical protein